MLDKNIIYDELFEIWANRVKTKRYTFEAFKFERAAGKYMLEESSKLANLSWKPSGFNSFAIHNPDRIICAPVYQDRIAEAWITEKYIKPFVTPKVIDNNMACQTGKGMKKAMNIIKKCLALTYQKYGYDFYFLQYDMKGYYDNLSHDVIKKQFNKMNPEGYQLLCNIVDSWESPLEECYAKVDFPTKRFGVPKGNLPSQWFGIMYLNELDHKIKDMSECMDYVRYMDDAVAIFRTKRDCRTAKKKIEEYLKANEMGIKLHPNKTVYAPINRGFNFCGWHYEIKPSGKILMHIKQSKKKEMKSKLRFLQKQYSSGKISLIEVRDVFQGIMNYLSWGDTFHLRRYLSSQFTFTHASDDDLSMTYDIFTNMDEDIDEVVLRYIMSEKIFKEG